MSFSLEFILTTITFIIVIVVGILMLVLRFFKKVEQGKALIVNTMKAEPVVTFTGRVVLPIVHKSEVMEISLKTIEIDRRGQEGLICKDNIRADIKVAFFVRVNKTAADVLKVAQAIGCARASDQDTLENLFSAKFSEALKTVGKQLDFEELYKERDSFRDKIIEVIGKDLNGYVLEDAAIDYLEQTPISSLDPDNILDSQGIRKITELTAEQHVLTNDFENREQMKITQQNVTAKEAILDMERREADAEAKVAREKATVVAQEKATTDIVTSQELEKSEKVRIETEQTIEIQQKNKQREIEVAEQNRQRVIAIEEERVKLAREQEVIAREREVELQRIAKEKALEEERREIANVIRERVAVEKTVAEEEERTKELRMVAEADRHKQVKIIAAEAEAQEILVKDIKTAEASQQAAEFAVKEQLARAEAEQAVADKKAQAKIRLAEGTQAEVAAKGLAEVRVKEANAMAIEKQGIAEAKAKLEQMQANAKGAEQQGMADVRVKEASAESIRKVGEAEAEALENHGMAEVKVREAAADVIEKQGMAEAKALEQRLLAEATGLAEKFKSLDALSEKGRDHEEFRIRLEQELNIAKESLATQQVAAEKQAEILSEAFKNAKIDIVGGEQLFFDRVINATSMAKSSDSFVKNSDTTRSLFKDYLENNASLTEDIKEILANPAISSQDLSNLSLSAFLGKLMTVSTPKQKSKIESLLRWVQKNGLSDAEIDKP
ncbi:hypothetical protein [Candidatus Venteria ishoeyi]|uniref:Inner membrane protein YqiK n=1 Tax=Candidatus Venteria ishoeyi TaxID=1899563 RepID=A0A1H6FFJ3_9GAMM|nr:hypothetical protein [Candidatus Venteria ishoeyi]SEH08840.1 Inner membrane protein YqiK [Candidatus Venteria ishoeyi]